MIVDTATASILSVRFVNSLSSSEPHSAAAFVPSQLGEVTLTLLGPGDRGTHGLTVLSDTVSVLEFDTDIYRTFTKRRSTRPERPAAQLMKRSETKCSEMTGLDRSLRSSWCWSAYGSSSASIPRSGCCKPLPNPKTRCSAGQRYSRPTQ